VFSLVLPSYVLFEAENVHKSFSDVALPRTVPLDLIMMLLRSPDQQRRGIFIPLASNPFGVSRGGPVNLVGLGSPIVLRRLCLVLPVAASTAFLLMFFFISLS